MDNEFNEVLTEVVEKTPKLSLTSGLYGFAGGVAGAISYQLGKKLVKKIKTKIEDKKNRKKIDAEEIDQNEETTEE